jgi:hypothetical protein
VGSGRPEDKTQYTHPGPGAQHPVPSAAARLRALRRLDGAPDMISAVNGRGDVACGPGGGRPRFSGTRGRMSPVPTFMVVARAPGGAEPVTARGSRRLLMDQLPGELLLQQKDVSYESSVNVHRFFI